MSRTFTLTLSKIVSGTKQPDSGRTVSIVSTAGSTIGTATETPAGSGQYQIVIDDSSNPTYAWWYIDGVPQFGYSNNSPFWVGLFDSLSGNNGYFSNSVTASTLSANLLLAANFQSVTAAQNARLGSIESATAVLGNLLNHYAVLSGFNIFTNANSISAGSITSIGSMSAYGGMSASNVAFKQVRTSDSISAGGGLSSGNAAVNQLKTLGVIYAGDDIYLNSTNTIHFGGASSPKLELYNNAGHLYEIGIEPNCIVYDSDKGDASKYHLFRSGSLNQLFIGDTISTSAPLVSYNSVQSNDFNAIDPIVGYQINQGVETINTIIATNLHVKAFIADIEQALAGSQIISKSVAKLYADVAIPTPTVNVTFTVESFEGYPNMNVFVAGDTIRMRQFTRSSSSLDVADAWLNVTSTPPTYDATGKYQTWTATILNGGGFTAKKGQLVLDYGLVGNGIYETVAVGATGPGYPTSPYSQIVTWKTQPFTDPYIVMRIGSLTGIIDTKFGTLTGIGMYASGNAYFTGNVNALNGYFNGVVTAQSGYIGNWNLDSSHLWSYVDNGAGANANRAELYASNADGSNGPPVIRAYQYDTVNIQYGYVGMGQIYRQGNWRNEFGFILADDFHNAPHIFFAKNLSTGTLTATIAGWNFDTTQLSSSNLSGGGDGTPSTSGILINSGGYIAGPHFALGTSVQKLSSFTFQDKYLSQSTTLYIGNSLSSVDGTHRLLMGTNNGNNTVSIIKMIGSSTAKYWLLADNGSYMYQNLTDGTRSIGQGELGAFSDTINTGNFGLFMKDASGYNFIFSDTKKQIAGWTFDNTTLSGINANSKIIGGIIGTALSGQSRVELNSSSGGLVFVYSSGGVDQYSASFYAMMDGSDVWARYDNGSRYSGIYIGDPSGSNGTSYAKLSPIVLAIQRKDSLGGNVHSVSLNAGGGGFGSNIAIEGSTVLTIRQTGWGLPTGTLYKAALTDSSTQTQFNQALMALITDLSTHGLIGT